MRLALLLISAAAVTAPLAASAQYGGRMLDPRLVAEAQREHAGLVQEYGGAETGQRAAYVDSVGRRVAAYSGIANPGSAYRFTLLNSAVENALSVGGGYIYVTRQLMTLMNDESELAFSLAHEVAHVAAGHAISRQQVAQRPSIGTILGSILGGIVGGGFGSSIAQMSQRNDQLRLLSFSRDQEFQADTLGMRYMIAAGYDPAGAPNVLTALSRNSALQARIQGRDNRELPEWASTHPDSANRAMRSVQEARASGRLGSGVTNRTTFLQSLDGAYVDDDPEQGIIDGRSFTHPDLRMQFSVPVGYLMQNGTDAVTITGSAGKAQFGGGGYTGTLDTYIYRVLQELGGSQRIALPPPQRTVINGLEAAYATTRANASNGPVDVSVVAYQWAPGTVYHFVMITAAGSGMGPFASMISSLRKITQAEASAIRPRVMDVVTVGPRDTVQSLADRMAYRDFKLDRFLTLNALAPNARLAPGQKVKVVVYGVRRRS
ncbi:M48 family metalloprotease [Sphingomonas sabuli]|uniref:M48 family metalloprotease n=1 Tax=Sphingomonas sabuli TaxID=2764186 RepID=A0A7G9L230_9SPHN|nr:M48 family metalloprotease [Sphingomonas sabuli]QNM82679.1 M48 family metalloprotease [Sphingomonas sabuli]